MHALFRFWPDKHAPLRVMRDENTLIGVAPVGMRLSIYRACRSRY
jgi:hypothetical protein